MTFYNANKNKALTGEAAADLTEFLMSTFNSIFAIMKYIILIICSMAIASCHFEQPKQESRYKLISRKIVPDSLKDDMAKWITSTVSASNSHMTGGDYEDPEDVVEEVTDRAETLFSRDSIVLFDNTYGVVTIPTGAEREIYWQLRSR